MPGAQVSAETGQMTSVTLVISSRVISVRSAIVGYALMGWSPKRWVSARAGRQSRAATLTKTAPEEPPLGVPAGVCPRARARGGRCG